MLRIAHHTFAISWLTVSLPRCACHFPTCHTTGATTTLDSLVAQLTSEKAVAEAYAGELKIALEEAYEYIEQLEEER